MEKFGSIAVLLGVLTLNYVVHAFPEVAHDVVRTNDSSSAAVGVKFDIDSEKIEESVKDRVSVQVEEAREAAESSIAAATKKLDEIEKIQEFVQDSVSVQVEKAKEAAESSIAAANKKLDEIEYIQETVQGNISVQVEKAKEAAESSIAAVNKKLDYIEKIQESLNDTVSNLKLQSGEYHGHNSEGIDGESNVNINSQVDVNVDAELEEKAALAKHIASKYGDKVQKDVKSAFGRFKTKLSDAAVKAQDAVSNLKLQSEEYNRKSVDSDEKESAELHLAIGAHSSA